MKTNTAKYITRAAIIGGLYTALTLALAPISYGPVQFRVSEALTVIPLIFPETAVGLILGCLISNIFSPNPLDLILGTAATFVAAAATVAVGKTVKKTWLKLVLGELPPILVNALIVPLTFLSASDVKTAYWLNVALVGAGQAAVILALGTLLYFLVDRSKDRLLKP